MVIVLDPDYFSKSFSKNLNAFFEQEADIDAISNCYNRFSGELRELQGNANGFTGLYELLIFTAIKKRLENLLGEEIQVGKKPLNSKAECPQYAFESKSGSGLVLTQNLRLSKIADLNNPKWSKRPDIVIIKNKKIMAVFEIKIWINQKKSFEETLEKMEELKKISDTDFLFFFVLGDPSCFRESLYEAHKTFFEKNKNKHFIIAPKKFKEKGFISRNVCCSLEEAMQLIKKRIDLVL